MRFQFLPKETSDYGPDTVSVVPLAFSKEGNSISMVQGYGCFVFLIIITKKYLQVFQK